MTVTNAISRKAVRIGPRDVLLQLVQAMISLALGHQLDGRDRAVFRELFAEGQLNLGGRSF
jgi:hypothetical protein